MEILHFVQDDREKVQDDREKVQYGSLFSCGGED
jgi:hypothetical protein